MSDPAAVGRLAAQGMTSGWGVVSGRSAVLVAPVSVAGYVRTLRVLGNWLAAEGSSGLAR